jgi:phosphatidate cytidylyltransferase
MLRTRLITSLIALPLVILAVWFDSPAPWLTVVAALAGLLGAEEFFRLTGVRESTVLRVTGDIFTILLVIHPHYDWQYTLPALLGVGIIVSLTITLWFVPERGKIIRWSWMMLGSLYIGWLLSLLVYLRLVPGTLEVPELGRNLVFFVLFVIFGTDTFAYIVGKAFGRHKMALPSALKTEGAVGAYGSFLSVG